MSATRLVSIIISSYNYGRFLSESIQSALGQTYPHTEVIVVDDGSTDESRDVIARYRGAVTAIFKANGGQASSFNRGFSACRGDIVLFLDSDDILLPTAVEKVAPLFRDADVAKVHWPLWVIDSSSRKTGKVFPDWCPIEELGEGDLRDAVLRDGSCGYVWPPTSGNAWARHFIEAVFPMPERQFRTSPDLYLCGLAPLFGRVGAVLEPLSCWRVHSDNNSWCEGMDKRHDALLGCLESTARAIRKYARAMGVTASVDGWKANSWVRRLRRVRDAAREIAAVVPTGGQFIFVDQNEWGVGQPVAGRQAVPFLERGGCYWGTPADDATAIREFERLLQAGASFMVFAWPAFWWLDYYRGFHEHLRVNFPCILQNDHLVVFDLVREGRAKS